MEKAAKKIVNLCKEELKLTKPKAKATKTSKADETAETNAVDDAEASEEEVSFEDKVAFTEKVRRLTNEGLTRLVQKVKEVCKDALEDVD